MKKRVLVRHLAGLLALLGILGATGAALAQVFESERHDFRLVTVAEGLVNPWSLAFLPNGDMLVTERPGRLRIIRDGQLDPAPVPGVPKVSVGGQGGLLDVALHPRFAENRLLFLSYAGAGEGGRGTEVARAHLVKGRLEALETILVVQPKSSGGRHFGSRLLFGRDGYLYVTLGERGSADRAQDLGDLAGSVLRITERGEAAPGNPFVGRPDARAEIYTYGNRNPQGLTLHPETGRIWEVEHGPKGGDEVNILAPGANYGWPVITYGRSYAGFKIGEGSAKPGMEQPVKYWVPSISPSGLAFYTGEDFPDWRGNLFVGALSGEALVRLEFDGEEVVGEERLLEELEERIRDVRQGPDGRLYLLTDAADGRLLRLDPIVSGCRCKRAGGEVRLALDGG
jgi:glucose/arabinose dehydrogenase